MYMESSGSTQERYGAEEAMEEEEDESRVTGLLWTCPRTLISRFKLSILLMAE